MIPVQRIVEVHLVNTPNWIYKVRYAVLLDKSPRELCTFAKAHPKVFVFPFVTTLPCRNYSNLKRSPYVSHIVVPFYIGNFQPDSRGAVIKQYVELTLGAEYPNAERIES